jgi:hypothetical protein
VRERKETEQRDARNEREIKDILMTPLATGIGRVSPEKWAAQTLLAIRHFVRAVSDPEIGSSLEWHTIYDKHEEVKETYGL